MAYGLSIFKRFCYTMLMMSLFVVAAGAQEQITLPDNARVIPINRDIFAWAQSADGSMVVAYNVWQIYIVDEMEAITLAELLPATVVDTATGDVIHTLVGFDDWIVDAVFLADGNLVTGHANGDIILWDITNGDMLETWQTPFGPMRLQSTSEANIVLVTQGNMVQSFLRFDLETGYITQMILRRPLTYKAYMEGINDNRAAYQYSAFDLSQDGTQLVVANTSDEIAVWETTSTTTDILSAADERPFQYSIRNLELAPDDQSIFYTHSNPDEKVLIHQALEGDILATLGENVLDFALSPNGTQVAWVENVNDENTVVKISDVDGSNENTVATFPVRLRIVPGLRLVRYTPDGTALRVIVGNFVSKSDMPNLLVEIALEN